jgi:hypothetical protein
MKLIILGGASTRNKDWVYEVGDAFGNLHAVLSTHVVEYVAWQRD